MIQLFIVRRFFERNVLWRFKNSTGYHSSVCIFLFNSIIVFLSLKVTIPALKLLKLFEIFYYGKYLLRKIK